MGQRTVSWTSEICKACTVRTIQSSRSNYICPTIFFHVVLLIQKRFAKISLLLAHTWRWVTCQKRFSLFNLFCAPRVTKLNSKYCTTQQNLLFKQADMHGLIYISQKYRRFVAGCRFFRLVSAYRWVAWSCRFQHVQVATSLMVLSALMKIQAYGSKALQQWLYVVFPQSQTSKMFENANQMLDWLFHWSREWQTEPKLSACCNFRLVTQAVE